MKARIRDTMNDSIEIYNHASRVTTLRDIAIFLTILKEEYNVQEDSLKQLMHDFYKVGNDERFTEKAINSGNVIDYFNRYIKDSFNIDFETIGVEVGEEKEQAE